jgi:hypothetical protein
MYRPARLTSTASNECCGEGEVMGLLSFSGDLAYMVIAFGEDEAEATVFSSLASHEGTREARCRRL